MVSAPRVLYGKDHEVRVGTTLALCQASAALPFFRRFEWKSDQNVEAVPVGFGSRLKVPHETLIDYTGTMEFEVDETDVGGTTAEPIAKALEADVTGNMTPLWIELKGIATPASSLVFIECLGTYNESIPSVDGIKHGTYDFKFRTFTQSYS
jgi:hypothetical protein